MEPKSILLAASYSMRIYAFDINSGLLLDEFEILNSQANRIATRDRDSHFFVAANTYVYCFDFISKQKKHISAYAGHEGNVTDLVISDTTFLSCGEDRTIKIWDKKINKSQMSISTDCILNCMIGLPSRDSVIVGDENGTISLYDLRNQKNVLSHDLFKSPVRSISISPNSPYFVVCSQEGITKCFKFEGNDFSQQYSIQTHNDTQLRCCISPNGLNFATSAADNSARIWDLNTGAMKHTLTANETDEWTWDIVFSQDSSKLCTGSSDCYCRLWDVENGRMIQQFPNVPKCISSIALLNS